MKLTKTKIIIFDIDGVLIRIPHYFTKELEKQGYSNAINILNSFFKDDIAYQCSEGKVNIIENIKPNEIAFFDDIQNNIDVASKHGIQALLFTDMKKLKKDLKNLGIKSI